MPPPELLVALLGVNIDSAGWPSLPGVATRMPDEVSRERRPLRPTPRPILMAELASWPEEEEEEEE